MTEGIDTAELGWGKAGEDIGCWGPGVGIDPSVTLHSSTVFLHHSHMQCGHLGNVLHSAGGEQSTVSPAVPRLGALPSSSEGAHCHVGGS